MRIRYRFFPPFFENDLNALCANAECVLWWDEASIKEIEAFQRQSILFSVVFKTLLVL